MEKTSRSSGPFRGLFGVLVLTCLAAAAPAARAASCESPDATPFLGGGEDNFAGGEETTFFDAKLSAYFANQSASRKNFDATATNVWVGHSFTDLPTGISGATLRFAACGVSGSTDNDSLLLEVEGGTNVAWYQFLADLNPTGTWNAGQCHTFEIDLGSPGLPDGLGFSTSELLTAMADGDLQFIVQDDTKVDFAELIVESCPAAACAGLPRGASAWWPFDEPAGNESKDLVSGADATWTAGLAAEPLGVHGGALSFPGSPASASAPNHPAFDFGQGDFSIDFWIKTTQSTGIRGLLEKRVLPQTLGWTVYLNDGSIGFQLAEGGSSTCNSSTPLGCTNYNSTLLQVADGEWHFVAVTVDRNSPTGLKIYVDDQAEVVFDPTLRQGSLSNSAPLLFGAHADGPGAGTFVGLLDEVELFGSALSRQQVQNLYDAAGGKCKTRLVSEWDVPWCRHEPVAHARPSLCNDSPADTTFGVRFAPLPAGTYPLGSCSIDGPTEFQLEGSQPVLVPARSCVHLELEVTPPAGMPAGATACYQVLAEDLGSGQVSASPSSFTASRQRFCIRDLPPSASLPVSVPIPLRLEVYNGADVQQTFNYRLESMPGDALPSALRLDGRPPGESVTGQVVVPARGTAEIETAAQLDELLPTTRQDVLLRDLDENAVLASRAYTSFVPTLCVADGDTLCLGGRFEVKVAWRDFIGQTGRGHAQLLTGDTGYFWFFNQENIEVVIKVLDGVFLNDHFWVFYGALSSVEYTLTVRDTRSGESASYSNASGQLASVGDIEALPGFTPASFASAPAAASPVPREAPQAPEGGCVAGPTALCLQNGRFRVQSTWRTALGESGPGQAVQLTSETGYFWFFSPNNVELVLKALDGNTINDHWWIFYGALSDVEYDIVVTDTVANTTKTYHNPLGVFASVGDITAFP